MYTLGLGTPGKRLPTYTRAYKANLSGQNDVLSNKSTPSYYFIIRQRDFAYKIRIKIWRGGK